MNSCFFFKKKGKKNRKVSKAIEQPSIKSIQNPIAQSNIIIQELESTENSNIF